MLNLTQIRNLLEPYGPLRSQPANEWTGDFSLPEALARFYQDIGIQNMRIIPNGNTVFFPSLSRLWSFQAGYRYNGMTGEPLSAWDPSWIVIAEQGTQSFVFDANTGGILLMEPGMGTWVPVLVCPDVLSLCVIVGVLASIWTEGGENILNEDIVIRPEYRRIAREDLYASLEEGLDISRILTLFGWET